MFIFVCIIAVPHRLQTLQSSQGPRFCAGLKNCVFYDKKNNDQIISKSDHFSSALSRGLAYPGVSSIISNDSSLFIPSISRSCKVRSYTRVWFLVLTIALVKENLHQMEGGLHTDLPIF